MVLAVPDGCHWKRAKRSGRESTKLHVSNGSTEGPKEPSTPARGRLSVETVEAKRTSVRAAVRFQRQYGGSPGPEYKPVLRDELALVATIHRYPPERLRIKQRYSSLSAVQAYPVFRSIVKGRQGIVPPVRVPDKSAGRD